MRSLILPALALALAACSQAAPDQEAIDKAVGEALAERDRQGGADGSQVASADGTSDDDSSASDSATRSTEPLREGLPRGMGSPYHMCMFTISIVGEHCGCMVNRATDAGIPAPAQVGMFGGNGDRASPPQIEQFTQIVKECSGYTITVTGSRSAAPQPAAGAQPAAARGNGRIVTCEFRNPAYAYDGQCRFVPAQGGDFSTTSLDGPYFGTVERIDLDVTAPGIGVLAIHLPNGQVERHEVSRSASDRACWSAPTGATFCAR